MVVMGKLWYFHPAPAPCSLHLDLDRTVIFNQLAVWRYSVS